MAQTQHTRLQGFPYPAVIQTLPHFADISWGNDVTDSLSFVQGDNAYCLFIDSPNVAERSSETYGRYALCLLVDAGTGRLQDTLAERDVSEAEPVLVTDDPDALIAFLGIEVES